MFIIIMFMKNIFFNEREREKERERERERELITEDR